MRIKNCSTCSGAPMRRIWPLGALALALVPLLVQADDGKDDAERIIVTATLTPHDSRHVPATLTVIDHEELLQRPSLDLLDALRGLPGISLQDRGVGGRRVLSLRGMESRHTLFLVDGRRVSASDDVFGHSDFQYDWVPLDAIERIEVVRGPLSSLYGSEALGGVVNIITRPAKGPWRANGSIVMGEQAGDGSDQAGRSERMSVLGRGNLLSDRIAATVNVGQNRRAAVAEEQSPWLSRLEDIDTQNWGVGFNIFPADRQRVDINLSEGDETRWRDTETSRKLRHRAYYDLNRELSSLRYRIDGDAGSLEARAYRAELAQTNRNTHNVAPSDPQTLIDDVLDLRGSAGIGAVQLLTLGSEFRTETLEHRAFHGGAGEVEHRALFVQDEISLGDAVQATLGWRRDRHEIFGDQDSPRAYLVWLPDADWSFKAGYGEGFRAPSLKQISPDYKWVGPYTFIGNADLRPETSRNVEAGVEYSGIDQQFSATVFDNRLDDLIVTQCLSKCTLPLGATYRFINVDSARIRGLELSARQKLGSVLSLVANYTLLSARDQTRDRELPERPRHALNLEATLEQGNWQYALRMEASSKQIAYEANTEHTLDRFALWHLGLRYQLSAQWRLQAGVDNLADHDFKRDVSTFAYNERGRFVWFGVDFSL